jgi:hypothetical protein
MAQTNNSNSSDVVATEIGVVLLLQVPRTNDKKELAAEQMFASLYGLLIIPPQGRFKPATRERLSFEIAVIHKRIGFYVWIPTYLKDYVEEQIYAQYPTVQISEVPDYTMNPDAGFETILSTELKLHGPDVLPIKTFQSFEVDPLAAITATLAKFDETEEAWLQVVMRPAPSNWHRKSEKYIAKVRGGGNKTSMTGLMSALWAPPETKTEAAKPTEYEQVRAKGAEEKSQKLAFEANVRILYRGNVPLQQARLRMQSIIASYKQFNTTYLNGFEQKRITEGAAIPSLYRARLFDKSGFIFNIEEVATLYHLPHTTVETPYILWASSQTAEPPARNTVAMSALWLLPTSGAITPCSVSAELTAGGISTLLGKPVWVNPVCWNFSQFPIFIARMDLPSLIRMVTMLRTYSAASRPIVPATLFTLIRLIPISLWRSTQWKLMIRSFGRTLPQN